VATTKKNPKKIEIEIKIVLRSAHNFGRKVFLMSRQCAVFGQVIGHLVVG